MTATVFPPVTMTVDAAITARKSPPCWPPCPRRSLVRGALAPTPLYLAALATTAAVTVNPLTTWYGGPTDLPIPTPTSSASHGSPASRVCPRMGSVTFLPRRQGVGRPRVHPRPRHRRRLPMVNRPVPPPRLPGGMLGHHPRLLPPPWGKAAQLAEQIRLATYDRHNFGRPLPISNNGVPYEGARVLGAMMLTEPRRVRGDTADYAG